MTKHITCMVMILLLLTTELQTVLEAQAAAAGTAGAVIVGAQQI